MLLAKSSDTPVSRAFPGKSWEFGQRDLHQNFRRVGLGAAATGGFVFLPSEALSGIVLRELTGSHRWRLL